MLAIVQQELLKPNMTRSLVKEILDLKDVMLRGQ
ncbi:predicted protein [Sclerotinia sclerotiorum 1980 UF-70]|uniref:Uncharacterized protein n=1 Tax=Sclerotinia sclerotiorum (strain ATCC 18683 / 1980 / Ss-1) TaxID=665079 RepID=A7EM39_SCLS1|nr:predicted protein [Sclerotinia sclerotiorum 1980 UF-70]EDO03905.1 predicted protein [Sclerotinia sclerotiorum 1980 UF-70]